MAELPHDFVPRSPALRTLKERGYLESASDATAIDAAMNAEMVTFYVGFDPTGASLHAGHMLQVMVMRVLQQHGHRPIAVVGGVTAMVGDPSGKTETRKVLTKETIARNAEALREQLGRFLHFEGGKPNDAVMLNNADWLAPLSYVDFLRDIGVHFTVNRMIAAKTYRERLDQELPLSFMEFNYQLLQAYDFLHLHEHYGCTMQCGGSDQWGNIIAGVELIRRRRGPEHRAYGLTVPLLTTADGKKMGKTERGSVWLSADKLKPFDFYQYWIGIHDNDVAKLLRLYTDVPMPNIQELCAAEGAALRDAKAQLAFVITALVHGEQAARQAQIASEQAFGDGDDWSAVPSVVLERDSIKLLDLVVDESVAAFKSKRQARQRIEAGAVRLDGEPCRDPSRELTVDDTKDGGLRLQAGKKVRFRVRLGGD